MSTFQIVRGTQSEIDNTNVVDGLLLFTTDTNNIYIDNGTTRILYKGSQVDSSLNASSTNAIQNAVVTSNINNLSSSITGINNSLTVNGVHFYYDYQGGEYGYNTDPNRGAGTFSPFNSYAGYTLPTLRLLASYFSTNPLISADSQVSIPLTEAKGISLTYVLDNYNDITANLVDNDGTTTLAFSHTGRGGYSGSYTNNSLDKNYKWLSISVSINGASTAAATVSDIHVTT